MEQYEKRFFDRGAKRFLFLLAFVVIFLFLLHIFMKWHNNRKFNNRVREENKDIIVQSSREEFEDKDTVCISHNGSLWKDFGFSESRSLTFAREVGLEYWYDDQSRLIVRVHKGDCYTVGWKKVPK